jgi:hypothetical protein
MLLKNDVGSEIRHNLIVTRQLRQQKKLFRRVLG